LNPFVPGDWAPDVLANAHPSVLSDDAIAAIGGVPGVLAGQVVPLAVEQPTLAEDLTGSATRATVVRQDNVVVIGFDPMVAMGGEAPLFDFHFVEGNRADAVARLGSGRYCIVPDHFLR